MPDPGGVALAGFWPLFLRYRDRALGVPLQEGEVAPDTRRGEAAVVDPLTGLGNRLALDQSLDAEPPSARGAVVLLNLDRFRFVNATMGSRSGDELLVQLAERLVTCLGEAGRLFRLAGDDFAIHVRGRPSPGKLEDLCDTIKSLFSQPFPLTLGDFWINASMGVALSRHEDDGADDVLERAGCALRKAKDQPGTVHLLHSPALLAEAESRGVLEMRLAAALDNGELYLEYQPILCLKTRTIETFEALLRWRHPVEGEVEPDRFIRLAESTGLIVPIGNWVLRTACAEAIAWPGTVGVAVNVAGDQLRDPNFLGHVDSCLRATGLAPGRLTIELTESIFSVDPEVVSTCLSGLRRLGVQVALDDFGRGFSSIHYLRSFSLDNLQVDRSFTRDMGEAGRDPRFADLLQTLKDNLGLAATIEGVETDAQFEQARAMGASAVQGFLISRPLAARDVPRMLARRARDRRRADR